VNLRSACDSARPAIARQNLPGHFGTDPGAGCDTPIDRLAGIDPKPLLRRPVLLVLSKKD
jgi:hypothetical protein